RQRQSLTPARAPRPFHPPPSTYARKGETYGRTVLEPELCFDLGDPFSWHGQIGLAVLQPDDRLTGKPGVDFLDGADVHERRSVDAQPLPWIESRLEVGECQVQRVVFGRRRRERQRVLRVEVRDVGDVDEVDAPAGARRQAHHVLRLFMGQGRSNLLQQGD